MEKLKITPFEEVLQAFRSGEMVIIADDAERENEGDLAVASQYATPEALAFMMREARGLVCVSISSERAYGLNLPLQSVNNSSRFGTPFTVSVDHCDVGGHGVSARERARTIQALVSPDSRAEELISPGHVFPLIAHQAGVMGRQGQTEGSYDIARLAGLYPSAVICEILNDDGSMARRNDIAAFAERFELKVTTVAEVLRYRIEREVLLRETLRAPLTTDFGTFLSVVYADDGEAKEHVALIYGSVNTSTPLCRIHSECLTGDVFGSRRCDCGSQLSQALEEIVSEGSGVVLYLQQEGRGIGLANKVRAYRLQEEGHDTVEANIELGFQADQRDYAVAAKMLQSLGIDAIRLMTNNPAKVEALRSNGITVNERIPLIAATDECAARYMETKRDKLGHLI